MAHAAFVFAAFLSDPIRSAPAEMRTEGRFSAPRPAMKMHCVPFAPKSSTRILKIIWRTMNSAKSRLRPISQARLSVVITVASLIATFAGVSALMPTSGAWRAKFAAETPLVGNSDRRNPNQQIRPSQNIALAAPFAAGFP